MIVEKFRELKPRREYIYLLALVFVAILWRMYPRTLVPHMFPADEFRTLACVLELMKGNFVGSLRLPHLEFYLVYGLNRLFGVDILKISFLINPVIGGISVLGFYFLAVKIIPKKDALWATTLFAFSETHLYRTCHFGSTEALGILFMLLFFGFYLRKQWGAACVLLIVMPFAHMLPFVFSVASIIVYTILNKGSRISILAMLGLIVVMAVAPFGLHKFLTTHVLTGLLSSFSWFNIFVYPTPELVTFLPYYSGFVIMSVVAILRVKEWGIVTKSLFFTSMVGIFISLLCYNSAVISPVRILVYMTIPLIYVTAKTIKDRRVLIFLVVVMMVGPLMGGLDRVIWVSDSITIEEMDAIEWATEEGYFKRREEFGFNYTRYGDWFFDTTIWQYMHLCSGKGWMGYEVFLNYNNKSSSWIYQPGKVYQPSYVFLSERIRRDGFFLDRGWDNTYIRSVVNHVPIEDIWESDPKWREIYNKGGVIIYENKIFSERRARVYESTGG